MMRKFAVAGPFPITCSTPRYVDVPDAKAFWTGEVKKWKRRKGVYFLAIRNRGLTPLYVGRTRRDFEAEALGTHQLLQFNGGLRYYDKGTPVVFLIAAEGRGSAKTAIEALETDLIQAAKLVNPKLRNNKGVKPPPWSIHGIGTSLAVRAVGKGTSKARAVKDFCRLMKSGKAKG